jgi:hypothetical protein
MARAEGISSAPNKTDELALLLSPWHALQPAATALSRLMEGEMGRALARIGLTAREFVTLLEIATVAFSSEEALAARADGEHCRSARAAGIRFGRRSPPARPFRARRPRRGA